MSPAAPTFGELLRDWRTRCGWSQLHLAGEAAVSARHISFLETGRSLPSREMVMSLARATDLPLRERNQWLVAAGYAPIYRETPLDDPAMAQVRRALKMILRQSEPLGGLAMDRHWDIVMANEGYIRILHVLGIPVPLVPYALTTPPRPNALELLFDSDLWRYVANWDIVAPAILQRLRRELSLLPSPKTEEVVRRHLARWPPVAEADAHGPVLAIEIQAGDLAARLLSAIVTLGTAQDITLSELRVELFFPLDEETAILAQRLADADR